LKDFEKTEKKKKKTILKLEFDLNFERF